MKKILLTAVVLIICCGLLETVEGTSITECKTQESSVEGLPSWLLLPLPINLWEEKSFVHVTRLARNSSDQDVPVLDGSWNPLKKDVDVKITPRVSGRNYQFGGFCGNKTVLLIITKMSPFHEGTYEVQTNQPRNASKVEWSYCNLTMTTAQEPDLVDKDTTTLPDKTSSTPAVPNVCPGSDTVEKPSTSDESNSNSTILIIVLVMVGVILFVAVTILYLILRRWYPHYFRCQTSEHRRRIDNAVNTGRQYPRYFPCQTGEHRRSEDTCTMQDDCHSTNTDNTSPCLDNSDAAALGIQVNNQADIEHSDESDVELHRPRTVTEPTDPSSERSTPQPC